ncbi:Hypothetical protein ADU72_1071 [Pediococcus damnosus]|uniref:Immunity protein n=1 Tax=Pediococcus damnosus TaxID=51663 RepID=A0AAC9B2D7_9LACO|nr:hypothetical protein [Pediococcus damnosus]AMV63104.1 Hypothetical protein ADU70_1624 [Pediococcus damnosus]AMV67004.1 Hypothetical protein ADU72_1071 [Pediococcus damnosus]AMV69397.1 Hypothetical protein ADU73_0991 [Pediococcus damnosus]KRN53648.1 hypothetical protein IV84_GL001861 [Pediococcus damnosus]GEA93335.1 hypothetical protein PDA01_12280 [Pediococcus damnosus]
MDSGNLLGLGFVLLGMWQFVAFFKTFNAYRKHAIKGTSGFAPYAFWSGLVYALIFLGMGISLIFNRLAEFLSGM